MVNLSYKIRDQNPFIVIAQVYNEILVLCCVFVFCGRFFFSFSAQYSISTRTLGRVVGVISLSTARCPPPCHDRSIAPAAGSTVARNSVVVCSVVATPLLE